MKKTNKQNDLASWNRTRSITELQNFIMVRHNRLAKVEL